MLKAWACAVGWSDDDKAKPALLGSLAAEMAGFAGFALGDDLSDLRAWLSNQSTSAVWRASNPIQFARARLALADSNPAEAVRILASSCWATYFQSRAGDLTALWRAAQYALEEARCKCKLSAFEKRRVRLVHPLPPNIRPVADRKGGQY